MTSGRTATWRRGLLEALEPGSPVVPAPRQLGDEAADETIDGPVDRRTEPCAEPDPLWLDPEQAVADGGGGREADRQPAQALGQAEMVDRPVALGKGEDLLVLEQVESSGTAVSGHGVDHPDLRFSFPQACKIKGVAPRDRSPNAGRQPAGPEAIHHRGAGAVVAHQGVAEPDHQDGRGRFNHG